MKKYNTNALMDKLSVELRNNSIVAIYEFMRNELDWKYLDRISWLSKHYNVSDKSVEYVLGRSDEEN